MALDRALTGRTRRDSPNAVYTTGIPSPDRQPAPIELKEGVGAGAPKVVALTDAATITVPAGADIVTVTLGGNRTVGAPTGTPAPANGDKLEFRLKQDGTGTRTVTWNAVYRFPGGTAPTLTTAANKTDKLRFEYNTADTKWDLASTTMNL
jgi:hypothetical protein